MKGDDAIHKRVFHYAHREAGALFQDFHISRDGYDDRQAEDSRNQYGENVLTERAADTVLYRLRRVFVNPFTIILLVLASISFVTDVLLASNFSRNIATSVIILCMLVTSGIVRFIQEMRSKQIANRLTQLIHSSVQTRRCGRWEELDFEKLVVGDTVRITAGDRVPADIRLTQANDLFLSQAVITGESAILEKNSEPLKELRFCSYAEYGNIAFMGSAVIGGTGEGVVLAVGGDTVYGGFTDTQTGRKNRFDEGANSIAGVLIRFMAALIPVVFIASGLTKGDWFSSFLFSLSVAVGLTPEMLPMVINACLARGSTAMSQKQTVVKNMNAMQGFGSMDVICVDKTGTLTGDTVRLEYYMDILGNGSDKVLDYAYLNSHYHTGIRNHLDAAVLKCEEMPGRERHFADLAALHKKLDEFPFDYDRKFASVLVHGEENNLIIIKGSLDEVCRRCSYIEYQGRCSAMQEEGSESIHAVVDEMLEDGMKVLAVAYKALQKEYLNVEDEQNFILLGYLAFFDAPKNTAASAIGSLQALHVGVKVLTGDQRGVAVSICRRLGIDTLESMTGAQLENLSENEAPVRIERTSVFAELTPKQKVKVLKTLQANGHTVGFLGDGMNDLPAIVEADVGISVDTAVEAVKECADVILLKKDLNVLEEGILEGRKAFSNMLKYITITASSNFGNTFAIVVASVFLPFYPMTSVQLLLLNLLYDILCLVLPWDHVDENTCARPLEWSGRTLGRFMRFFGPISSVFDVMTFAFLYFVLCPFLCGAAYPVSEAMGERARFISIFQTGWFLESMWTQILILHLLRTKKLPFIQSKPSFPVMFVTMFGIVLLTAMVFTPLGGCLGLTAMPIVYFGFLIAIAAAYMLLVTIAKELYVHRYHELF